MEKSVTIIDGDRRVKDAECPYYCSPSCHPMQTGPDWKYGCTHKAWPANRRGGDFVPIVECGGKQEKCEIPAQFIRNMKNGLRQRVRNARAKIEKYEKQITELDTFLGDTP